MSQKPLRMLYVTATLEPGGLQKRCVQIASEAARRGHRVWVVAAEPGSLAEAVDPGCELVVLGVPPPFRRGGPAKLWRLLREVRPDVVHGFTNVGTYFATPLARLRRVPAVVATLGLTVDGPLLSRTEWRVAGLLLRFAHAVTGNSREVVESARRILRLGDRLRLIPNYLDLERFPPRDEVTRHGVREELVGLGVPGDAVVVGTVGRLVEAKDPTLWLRAAAAAPAQVDGRPVHWVWVGDGDLRPRFETTRHELGLDSRVHLLGTRDDVPRLLQALDLFVLSSATEGMPNAVLEALAAGLPVVATHVGGVDAMVLPDQTGWLVPVGEVAPLTAAVTAALGDPDRLAAYGRQGRALVERNLAREVVVGQYFDLYEALLQGRRRPR